MKKWHDNDHPKDKTYREELVSLAYKIVPLPSGCSNCWGDSGEGCTDECRRSSDEHSKKINETVQAIQEHIDKARIKELEWAKSQLVSIPCEENCTPERHAHHQGSFDMCNELENDYNNRIKQLKDKGGS